MSSRFLRVFARRTAASLAAVVPALLCIAVAVPRAAPAQDSENGGLDTKQPLEHPNHGHSMENGVDHRAMDHEPPRDVPPTAVPGTQPVGDEQPRVDGMGSMQGGKAPADVRDPDAYAGGLEHGAMHGMDMADDALFGRLSIEKFEHAHSAGRNAQAVDVHAWYGGDYNKLWLKADAERASGRLEDLRSEALWDHAIAPFWGLQLGARHDFGEGPDRNWVALGVQGLAPYWFEVEATVYAGSSGRTAARVELQYDVLFTQRLILQPDIEFTLYGKSDPERAIGSGFSTLDVGLRLRYEIHRQFAPYVGAVFTQKYGKTADFARANDEDTSALQLVIGVRAWF